MSPILKIVPRALWETATAAGVFAGAPVDVADGFIHFSTRPQVEETAARHFAGQRDVLLVALDPARLGTALKWETSRGGALFPHLYGSFATADALWVRPIPLDAEGRHDFAWLSP